jgi:molybdate transport system substrate-binding protein
MPIARRAATATRRLASLVAVVCAATAGVEPSRAQPARGANRAIAVAAASDLQAVFPELAARFERNAGAKVAVSFGSSGNFFAQIQHGAPFDVFFSADVDYPRQLVAAGLADKESLYEYATGRIVLWTRKATGIDVRRGMTALLDPRVRRLAIANPQHAPYGRAAVAAMQSAGVYEAVKGKLVVGENISQAAQLADSGNADAGIIALSLALGPALRATGMYFEIPAATHAPIRQAAVVISASRNKALAGALIDFVKQSEVRQLLQRFGFVAPEGQARE